MSLFVAAKAAYTPGHGSLTASPCHSASSLPISLPHQHPELAQRDAGPFFTLSIPMTVSVNSKLGGRALMTASLGPEAILGAQCSTAG